MLSQNFKYAFRYILNNKGYSIINLTGLAAGLVSCIIIYLILYQEINYDRFHKNIVDIFQVMQYEKRERGSAIRQEISYETADVLSKAVPDFDVITKIPSIPAPHLMIDGQRMNERGIYADPDLFNVFSFSLTKGNAGNALETVHSIVISESIAAKLFPGTDPVGKEIITEGPSQQIFTVTGIMKDIPVESSLQFNYIIPYHNFVSLCTSGKISMKENNISFYVRINKNSLISEVNRKISNLVPKPDTEGINELFITPFAGLHINPVRYKDATTGGMIAAVIVLSIIGFLILFVACVNYTNLATALAFKRTKDICVKKVYGSSGGILSGQFLLESFILSLFAIIISVITANLLIPWFNSTFNWNLAVRFSDPTLITGLSLILLFTSMLSGTYPAFYLSRLNPLKIIKGSGSKGRKSGRLRKVLMIIQFFVAAFLIIISISNIKQIRFIKVLDLGVNIDSTVMVSPGSNKSPTINIKGELLKLSFVESVTVVSQNPLLVRNETEKIDVDGMRREEIPMFSFIETDFDFVKTMGLRITSGRDFDRSVHTDSSNFLINEKALKVLGTNGSPGTRLSFQGKEGIIIGVINDYHMTHVNFPIKPMVISCNGESGSSFLVKFRSRITDLETGELKKVIEKFGMYPGLRIEKMRDVFEGIYKDNIFRIGKLTIIFSIFALGIACLGLISLSVLNTELRTREIAIHRVHGAGIPRILILITREYFYLVIYSILFAIPAGFLIMSKLFSRTAYHTRLSWWIFGLAVIIVFFVVVLTVGWQGYKAAVKNPADTLKYE